MFQFKLEFKHFLFMMQQMAYTPPPGTNLVYITPVMLPSGASLAITTLSKPRPACRSTQLS